MAIHRISRCVHIQIVWMLGTVVVLAGIESLSLELFYSLSLIGLLVVAQLTAPASLTPPWRRRLRRVVVAGLGGFVYLAAWRLFNILTEVL